MRYFVLIVLAGLAMANDPPVFRKVMQEFRRNVDPIEGMKEQNEMQSKGVITVENDSAYRIDVEANQGGTMTKEVLIARRIGDC